MTQSLSLELISWFSWPTRILKSSHRYPQASNSARPGLLPSLWVLWSCWTTSVVAFLGRRKGVPAESLDDSSDEDSDDDADSSSSCYSEVHSLPDFLSPDADDEFPIIVPAAPPVIHLTQHSMLGMEAWLVQHLRRNSLHLYQPGQGKGCGPSTKQIQNGQLSMRRTSECSSPTFPDCGSVFSMSATRAPLLMLPAPPFLPEALDVGMYCEVGVRDHNEDMAFAMRLNPSGHALSSFSQAVCCGLFDGHGGDEVAAHLTEFLPDLVVKRSNDIMKQGAREVAEMLMGLEEDMIVRYQKEWLPIGRDPGSTALVTTIMDDHMLVANVGDCRLLLISEARDSMGNCTAYVSKSTSDHNCARNPQEALRVHHAGGVVDSEGYVGSLLEVSRSLGDFQTKGELGQGIIIPDPELYTWKLGAQDLMAVAVSDGISGAMDDMEICNMVCTLLNDKKHYNDPAYAARELANFAAFAKHSTDNCSAIVMVFKERPPPAPARRRLFSRCS